MGFFVALAGIILMIIGLFGSIFGIHLGFGAQLVIVAGGAVTTVLGAIMASMSFYRRTSAAMAIVRTGYGGNKVVLDGGAIVWPMLHRILEINLRTMKLGVNPH